MLGSRLTTGLRRGQSQLSALRRQTTTKILSSPFFRSRLGAGDVETLAISPGRLGSLDCSTQIDLTSGGGFVIHDGATLDLAGLGLFDFAPPSSRFAAFASGFAWLDTLRAQRTDDAQQAMREWTFDWLEGRDRFRSEAREASVVVSRLRGLLTHADILLSDAEPEIYDAIILQIIDDLHDAAARWRSCEDGPPRVVALTTVLLGALAIAESDEMITRFETLLVGDLAGQIDGDGGPLSRCSSDVLAVLIDLIPLLRAYAHVDRMPPAALHNAQARMLRYLRTMRLGDMALARFNGVGAIPNDTLFRVLKLDAGAEAITGRAVNGYVRFEAADVTLVADIARAPHIAQSRRAHAGCFSFELSDGRDLVLANCGLPGAHPASGPRSRASVGRATAFHNTLELGGQSSASFVASEANASSPADFLSGPAGLTSSATATEGAFHLEGAHDGYAQSHGLRHARSVELARDGASLRGADTLEAPSGRDTLRLADDVGFAIRFHLAPGMSIATTGAPNTLELTTPSGRVWSFASDGPAQAYVEESQFLASGAAAIATYQIVLRGLCAGNSRVGWSLTRAD
ncbi:MAG: heparinase II/III family protein [Pseudomonadota bacterium]